MLVDYALFSLLLITVTLTTVITKKLTIVAAITAAVVAIFLYVGTGYSGIVLLGSFFIIGVLATSWKREEKEEMGYAEPHKGKRNAGQVLANGGMAGLLGLLAFIYPNYKEIFITLVACSLSSAAADTVSSELGIIYGKKFINITSLRKDKRGENGVVSLEGSLLGVAASAVMASIAAIYLDNYLLLIIIVVAGTIGNFMDSILGATLERKHAINNNAVNFLNTFAATIAGLILILAMT